ncbi:hypothetical protein ATY76_22335 [Rhizobium sp. R339]|nr:hypothetical protein ATY76_22335 [Rhizobium sp. R339]
MSRVVDGVNHQDAANILGENFTLIVALCVLVIIVEPLLQYFNATIVSSTVAVPSLGAVFWKGYRTLEAQDVAFHNDNAVGQSVSRIKQASRAVQRQLTLLVDFIPRITIQLVGAVIFMSAIAWPLLIPIILWLIGNIFNAKFAIKRQIRRAQEVAAIESVSLGALTDLYNNIVSVKLFGSERFEAVRFTRIIRRHMSACRREDASLAFSDLVSSLLNGALLVLTLLIGALGVAYGWTSTGDFVAGLLMCRSLGGYSRSFIAIGQSASQALGTLNDAVPVLVSKPTIQDRPYASPLRAEAKDIVFENVSFVYPGGFRSVEEVSLNIKGGEKVGLVGMSGAGKSTLVSLLLRLYDVSNGAIYIGGKDIRMITQDSLRDSIGVITQDTSLFHRSIADNIAYGKFGADLDEIQSAAKKAKAHDFIINAKDDAGREGYQAMVGERGLRLSGGQRQRIALARLFLKDAPILILDEATSALDSEVEAAIQENLSALTNGKTVVCIAHRLSTILSMDRIIVLEKGRVIEQGTPRELRERDGLFSRLWRKQILATA